MFNLFGLTECSKREAVFGQTKGIKKNVYLKIKMELLIADTCEFS